MSEATPDQGAESVTDGDGGGGSGGLQIPKFMKRGDIALALGVIAILIVLLLPMPTWLLDFSLAVSITFSAIILMMVLFINLLQMQV